LTPANIAMITAIGVWPGTGSIDMNTPMASAPVTLRLFTAKYIGWRNAALNGLRYQAV
jgi:hypothetical protein